MKENRFNLALELLMGLVFLAIIFSSCGIGSESKTSWFRDPYGAIHTKNVKLVQREVPFTIIIPSYLPGVLSTDYTYGIIGPIKYAYQEGIEVKIAYIKEDHQIYISEQNVRLVMGPTEELEPVYLDIDGTKVLCQKAQMAGSSGITEGLSFDWNQNSLTFAVRVFSISKEEAIKIVESMIKQME